MPSGSFKTKNGYCHLLDDEILISRNKIVTEERNNRLDFPTVFLGGVAIISFITGGQSVYSYFKEQPDDKEPSEVLLVMAALYALAGVILLINLWVRRNKTQDYLIKYDQIKSIDFIEAKSFSKCHFIINYDKNGKLKQRFIPMQEGVNDDLSNVSKAKKLLDKIS